jgi:hypothetical protein
VSEPDPKAFERFRALTKRVMATPKNEIDAREAKYQQLRKTKNRKRHR